MYALHPGSLPPHSPKATERMVVTAEDLVALFNVPAEECITWDPADGYDWNDFIHLYPSYYGRYHLIKGKPSPDVPDPNDTDTPTGRSAKRKARPTS